MPQKWNCSLVGCGKENRANFRTCRLTRKGGVSPTRDSAAPDFVCSRKAPLDFSEGAVLLSFDVKIDAGRNSVLGDFLPVQLHFEVCHTCPSQTANGFGRFGHGVLGCFGEAFLGSTNDVDDFLCHFRLLEGSQANSGQSRARMEPELRCDYIEIQSCGGAIEGVRSVLFA